MRISTRLSRLEASAPKCDGWAMRVAREGEPAPPAEPCRVCGGDHCVVVTEVVVATPADVERVRAMNAATKEGRP